MLQEALPHAIDVFNRDVLDTPLESQNIFRSSQRSSCCRWLRCVMPCCLRRRHACKKTLLDVIEFALGDTLLCDISKRPIERGLDHFGADARESGRLTSRVRRAPKLIPPETRSPILPSRVPGKRLIMPSPTM